MALARQFKASQLGGQVDFNSSLRLIGEKRFPVMLNLNRDIPLGEGNWD